MEIRYNRVYLLLYLVLGLLAALGCLYFLWLTDTFPRLITKIAGSLASIILITFVVAPILKHLFDHKIQLRLTNEVIGFFGDKGNWKEVKMEEIESLELKRQWDGYKMKKILRVVTKKDEDTIKLNGLQTSMMKIESFLNGTKS